MDWKTLFPENEQPLDHLLPDGGFCGIFRTIGCVGDSLSSGEFQIPHPNDPKKWAYYDMYEYSWGQFMARTIGSKVYNFSKGGMTAKQYMESFAESRGFWDPELHCQAYIIALGVNDIQNQNMPVGTLDDVSTDWRSPADNFAGYYTAIIARLKEISPDAKFFFVTIPKGQSPERNAKADLQAEFLRQLTPTVENAYLIDLNRYAPAFDEEFRDKFFLNGHMNPMGYAFFAKIIISYVDYIIRHNTKDFDHLGFVKH